ncbi:MAG: hypothetical protein AAF211_08285 [Myxococcota bacterium]
MADDPHDRAKWVARRARRLRIYEPGPPSRPIIADDFDSIPDVELGESLPPGPLLDPETGPLDEVTRIFSSPPSARSFALPVAEVVLVPSVAPQPLPYRMPPRAPWTHAVLPETRAAPPPSPPEPRVVARRPVAEQRVHRSAPSRLWLVATGSASVVLAAVIGFAVLVSNPTFLGWLLGP